MHLGIDIGGTKVEAVALDQNGKMHGRQRMTTPADYNDLLFGITWLVDMIEESVGPLKSVGIGSPGAKCPDNGVMQNADNVALNGRPFEEDLRRRLGREVRVANDAHCFALSEAFDGAAAGASTVFGAILGTGVGGGIVIDGKLLKGPNAVTGEWGHNPLPWPSPAETKVPRCYCGRRSCIESFLSGPGMQRDHRAETGHDLLAHEIAEQSSAGDVNCRNTVLRYCDRLARTLATVINLLDPEVIVLGGGVSNIEAIYEEVPKRWAKYTFCEQVRTRLVRNEHGDASGVRGAARL